MRLFRLFTALAALTLGFAGPAQAQLSCTASAPSPSFVRAEGIAEMVSDILLTCTGGSVTVVGANVPRATLTLAAVAAPGASAAPNITSRSYSDGGSEALLSIDEPTFEEQKACQIVSNSATSTTGCGSNFVGVTGGLNYKTGSNGSNPTLPNVFQGRTAVVNGQVVLQFPNIPLDAGVERRLRFVNVRADATLIPVGGVSSPLQFAITSDTPSALTVSTGSVTASFVTAGISASLGGPNGGWTLRQCDAGPQSISLSFREGFQNAFKNRFIATTGIDNPEGPPRFEQFQRFLGSVYYTESGFFRLEMPGAGSVATAFQGGSAIGLATNGTRLLLRVPSLPSGVSFSFPNRIRDTKGTDGTNDDLYARLVLGADGSGAGGGFAPEDNGTASLTSGVVVYEIISHDPFGVESLNIPIQVTYTATPAVGAASLSGGLASQYDVSTPGVRSPSTFLPAPRFNVAQFTGLVFQISACPVQITVNSAIPGQSATIDGMTVNLPQVYSWVPGSVHSLVGGDAAISNPLPNSATRFGGWSAGSGNPLSYITPGVASTVTANYTTHYLVRNRVEPVNSGSIVTNRLLSTVPGVGAVYWPQGNITVTPVPAAGFRFIGFSGALTGTSAGTFTVSGPNSLVARFEPTGTDTTAPFGSFDSPRPPNHLSLNGQIGVTGWALDDRRISRILIYRARVASDPDAAVGFMGLVYIGDATITCKARPDIVSAYPNAVNNDCAGWGYALLTYGLPGGGVNDNNFTLHAYAEDWAGNRTFLGSQAITTNNNQRTKPFGTIDNPSGGETIPLNSNYTVRGWILATPGRAINAATIKLVLDGQEVTNTVSYGSQRPDVAAAFPSPTYTGSLTSGFSSVFSTSGFADGDVRQVAMVASDNGSPVGTDGIGSRPFLVGPAVASDPVGGGFAKFENDPSKQAATQIDAAPAEMLRGFRTGWDFQAELNALSDEPIRIPVMGRMEVHVGVPLKSARLVTSDGMPIGSSLAQKRGAFYWHAPPAFLGDYEVELVPEEGDPIRLKIRIGPRFSREQMNRGRQ